MQPVENSSLLLFLKKFGELSTEASDDIEKYIVKLELPKKMILLKAGKVCDHLYFLEKGLARCYSEENEKIFTNDIVIDGELLTSFSSFISRQPSIENIELLEDSILQAIQYDDLQMLYKKHTALERIGRLIAEHHYNSLASQTHRLRFSTSTQRYDYLFTHKIEIVKRAPLGVIASYLGMTIENLSRIRGKG